MATDRRLTARSCRRPAPGPAARALAIVVVLGLGLVAAGCGGVKTGDDDTTAQATTTSRTSTSDRPTTTVAPGTTSPDARQNEDIVASDVTVDPALRSSSYCQQARSWARSNPLLATGYDPRNPAELESAYRATAEHEHALLDVAPTDLVPSMMLIARQWDAVVALFDAANWDYAELFERQSAQVAATLQGDRGTQDAATAVSDYDVRVCGVG